MNEPYLNEPHFAYKVRQHLNLGLRELRPETLERLSAARQAALARQKRAIASPALATGGRSSFRLCYPCLSQTLAAVAFLLCAFYSTFWVADQCVQELCSIDSAILSDELPLGAFTDKGFAAWLDSKSAE
ncbi:MAG: DUF3619 family protein [Candidatus Accumulibacter sp.]|jgi:hypothetical protein|nr:DUF3619 family protein [Accumulibacter sp.]